VARAVREPCCSSAAAARPAIGDVAALASARQPARVRDLGVRLHYVFVANTCLIGTYDFFKHGGGASSRRLLFSDALFGLLIGLLFGILVLFSDALFILSELGILPLLLAAALDRHHALRLLHHADGGPVSFSWPGSLAFTACSVSSRRPVRFLRDGCLPAATATHATASRRRRWLRAFVPTPLAGLRHPLSEQGCARINVSRAISANLWAAAKLPRVPLAPACPSIARTVLWGWGRVPMLTASYARH
jgi:hypothetical protein